MIITQIQSTFRLGGKFKFCAVLLLLIGHLAHSADIKKSSLNLHSQLQPSDEWSEIELSFRSLRQEDRVNGLSYIVSGSLALVGGLIGQNSSSDPLEKGVYTLFQTIGVASIGYGIFKWKIGNEERSMFQTTARAKGLTQADRAAVMTSYFETKQLRKKDERFVRALTHGLIAGLNFYGASKQKNESLKNTLFFLGGVNTLATLSYTF